MYFPLKRFADYSSLPTFHKRRLSYNIIRLRKHLDAHVYMIRYLYGYVYICIVFTMGILDSFPTLGGVPHHVVS